MPRDDDKLLRQLSLVSFLLSQHRPATPAEVRQTVEGYALMTDQAFARRFYEDRDDLARAGIVIESDVADHGAEAYYLPEENYRLPDLALTRDELTALSVALALLEGRFAYARLLRLALASLTRGHPDPSQDEVERVAVALAPDEEAGRLGALLARFDEGVSRGKTVTFSYLTAEGPEPTTRTLDPYALVRVGGHWYAVGRDHSRDGIRMFRLSRIEGPVRFAGKRPRDFSIPDDFDPAALRARAPWQLGALEGEAVVSVAGDLAWWVERSYDSVVVREKRPDGTVVFTSGYADGEALIVWVLGLGMRGTLLGPGPLRSRLRGCLAVIQQTHAAERPNGTAPFSRAEPADARGETPTASDRHPAGGVEDRVDTERTATPIPPERLARVLGLLYYLLDESRGEHVALAAIEHDLALDRGEIVDDLSLLNLVNHGGGTYLLYAELDGDHVRVDREPEGELLAHPARLSPLIARALLLALSLVGDVLPLGGRRSLASARSKVERLVGSAPAAGVVDLHDLIPTDETVVSVINQALREQLLVQIEYYTATREDLSTRLVEPYLLFHSGDGWYMEAYCLKAEGQRTFRLDRIRTASLTDRRFASRPEIDLSSRKPIPLPGRERGSRWALLSFPETWRRRLTERGLEVTVEDGRALARIPYLDQRWLVREVLRYGGAAVLLEPVALRLEVAETAAALLARYSED